MKKCLVINWDNEKLSTRDLYLRPIIEEEVLDNDEEEGYIRLYQAIPNPTRIEEILDLLYYFLGIEQETVREKKGISTIRNIVESGMERLKIETLMKKAIEEGIIKEKVLYGLEIQIDMFPVSQQSLFEDKDIVLSDLETIIGELYFERLIETEEGLLSCLSNLNREVFNSYLAFDHNTTDLYVFLGYFLVNTEKRRKLISYNLRPLYLLNNSSILLGGEIELLNIDIDK